MSKVMVNMRETLEIPAFSEAEATAQAPWLDTHAHGWLLTHGMMVKYLWYLCSWSTHYLTQS